MAPIRLLSLLLPALLALPARAQEHDKDLEDLGLIERDPVPGLTRKLGSEDPAVRLAAVRDLGLLIHSGPPVIEALTKALQDPSYVVELEAALALAHARVRHKRVLRTLSHATAKKLKSEDMARVAVALGLVFPPVPDTLTALVYCLKHPEPAVRKAAAASIGAIGPRAGHIHEALLATLEDEDIFARLEAAGAFVRMDLWAPPIENVLLEALKDDNRSARELAVRVLRLREHVSPQAASALVPLLTDPDIDVADQAAAVLALFDEKGSMVLPLLKHDSPAVRLRALRSLARERRLRSVEDAYPVLQQLLQSEDPKMRAAAVTALASLGGDKVIPNVATVLSDPSPAVVIAAAQALGRAGRDAHSARPALLDMVTTHKNEAVQIAAAHALAAIGGKALGPEDTARLAQVWARGTPRAQVAVAMASWRLGTPADRVARLLLHSLDSEESVHGACEGLAVVSPLSPEVTATVTEQLAALLDDEQWGVRRSAAMALGGLGAAGKPALPKLVLLLTEQKDPREEVRIAAALAQWRIAGDADSAVRFLERSLRSDARAALLAAQALERIGPAAAPAQIALEKAALHYDRDVRRAADAALAAIGK